MKSLVKMSRGLSFSSAQSEPARAGQRWWSILRLLCVSRLFEFLRSGDVCELSRGGVGTQAAEGSSCCDANSETQRGSAAAACCFHFSLAVDIFNQELEQVVQVFFFSSTFQQTLI